MFGIFGVVSTVLCLGLCLCFLVVAGVEGDSQQDMEDGSPTAISRRGCSKKASKKNQSSSELPNFCQSLANLPTKPSSQRRYQHCQALRKASRARQNNHNHCCPPSWTGRVKRADFERARFCWSPPASELRHPQRTASGVIAEPVVSNDHGSRLRVRVRRLLSQYMGVYI